MTSRRKGTRASECLTTSLRTNEATFELLSVGAGGILGHASAFWRLDRKDYALWRRLFWSKKRIEGTHDFRLCDEETHAIGFFRFFFSFVLLYFGRFSAQKIASSINDGTRICWASCWAFSGHRLCFFPPTILLCCVIEMFSWWDRAMIVILFCWYCSEMLSYSS